MMSLRLALRRSSLPVDFHNRRADGCTPLRRGEERFPEMLSEAAWLDALFASLARAGISPDIIDHRFTLRASEKQALLPQGVGVQKTVTLQIDRQLLLVSGVGDFRLTKATLRSLSKMLGLPAHCSRRATINPATFPAEETSGLPVGMVSPFIRCTGKGPLTGIALLAEGAPYSETAISLSLTKSAIVPSGRLFDAIGQYHRYFIPHLPLMVLHSE